MSAVLGGVSRHARYRPSTHVQKQGGGDDGEDEAVATSQLNSYEKILLEAKAQCVGGLRPQKALNDFDAASEPEQGGYDASCVFLGGDDSRVVKKAAKLRNTSMPKSSSRVDAGYAADNDGSAGVDGSISYDDKPVSILSPNMEKAIDWLGRQARNVTLSDNSQQVKKMITSVAETTSKSHVTVGSIRDLFQCTGEQCMSSGEERVKGERTGVRSSGDSRVGRGGLQPVSPGLGLPCHVGDESGGGDFVNCGGERSRLDTETSDQSSSQTLNSLLLEKRAQQEMEEEMNRFQRMTSWGSLGTTGTLTDATVETASSYTTYDTYTTLGTDTIITGTSGTTHTSYTTGGHNSAIDIPSSLGIFFDPNSFPHSTINNEKDPPLNTQPHYSNGGTGLTPNEMASGFCGGMTNKGFVIMHDDDGTPLPAGLIKLQQQRSQRHKTRDGRGGSRHHSSWRRRRRRKVVQFDYPPISSLKECPRIDPRDRNLLFFSEEELDQIEADRASTKTSDDVEIVAVVMSSQPSDSLPESMNQSGSESQHEDSSSGGGAAASNNDCWGRDTQLLPSSVGGGTAGTVTAASQADLPPRVSRLISRSPTPRDWSRNFARVSDSNADSSISVGDGIPPSPAKTESASTSATNTPEKQQQHLSLQRCIDDVAENIIGIVSSDFGGGPGGLRMAAARAAATSGQAPGAPVVPSSSGWQQAVPGPALIRAPGQLVTGTDSGAQVMLGKYGTPPLQQRGNKGSSSSSGGGVAESGKHPKPSARRKRNMLQGVQIYLRNRSLQSRPGSFKGVDS